MTLDLVSAALVAAFAVWGTIVGLARQVAQGIAIVVAWLLCGFWGHLLGPRLAARWGVSAPAGVVLLTIAGFIVTFIVVRWALTRLIRRALHDEPEASSSRDHSLGFFMGGLRGFALVYLALCALALLERSVTVAGKSLKVASADSRGLAWVKRHNLVERHLFAGLDDLTRAATAAVARTGASGELADELKELKRDPRFRRLVERHGPALAQGEAASLLRSDDVTALLRDAAAMEKVRRVNEKLVR